MYCEMKDTAKALIDLNKAIQLNPNESFAFNLRGMIHKRRGDLNNALADFSHCIEIDPNTGYHYTNRAYVYLQLGDTLAARRDLKEAIRRGNPDARGWLEKLK
jgi:Flp pilus assembly protein TadD